MAGPLRVLYATDGSAPATAALASLLDLLRPGALQIDVVCVVAWTPGLPELPDAVRDAAVGAATDVAETACRTARLTGASAVPRVLEGHPAEAIVGAVEAMRPELVLVGSRGLRGDRATLSGTVSAKVARYSRASTLVLRDGDTIRRVLVGYDSSPDADRAIDLLAALPLRQSLSVTVATAYDVPPVLAADLWAGSRRRVPPNGGDGLRHARTIAEAVAEQGARRLARPGLVASAHAVNGEAATQLAVVAGELGSNLLVVGSRGRSGIRRFALGSTSAALLAGPPTNLLIVRNPDERR